MTASTTSNLGPLFATAQQAASDNVNAYSLVYGSRSKTWSSAEVLTLAPNWNKLFPYQLCIMERVGKSDWRISESPKHPAPYTLPIPPQMLDINMNFAMEVAATQGGVIEQASKTKFREISLSGTTGVLPLRGSVRKPTSPSSLESIFIGTVRAVQNVASQVANNVPANNIIPAEEFENGGEFATGTGYYQMLLLKRFLEWYDQNKNPYIALGFAIWKEKEIYITTPASFRVTRSTQSRLAYNFTLSLKAWKRVIPSTSKMGQQVPHVFPGRDTSAYTKILNTIQEARRILENNKKVVAAVRGDVNNLVFGNLRQLAFLTKDIIGQPFAVADLGYNLYNDFKEPLLEKVALTQGANFKDFVLNNAEQDSEVARLLKEVNSLAIITEKKKTKGGKPDVASRRDALGNTNNEGGSPALKLFANPEDYYNFWSNIQVGQLALRPETVRKIQEDRQRLRALSRQDYENMRDDILSVLADFEVAVGVGDSTYNSIYGTTNRQAAKAGPTDRDWDIIFALGESASAIDALAASETVNPERTTAIELIAGLSSRAGIAFTKPVSKYLVPFPYGYTLEMLANQYLGSPDRWTEIAALNGLQSPYVDEVGFTQDLAGNGSGNSLPVSDASRYYVGQPIWVTALGVRREKRRITKISVLGPSTAVLFVDGAADCSKFTTALESFIQAFLPNTVNSLQYLYIPSNEEADNDWVTKDIPGVDVFDPLLKIGGVDLLLDNDGDLVITADGSTRLATGLTNLIQRVKIGFGTPQGSLLQHPEFGFGIIPGISSADVQAQDVLTAAKQFIQNEEGFSGVDFAQVEKIANSLRISLAVRIAGTGKTVPLSFEYRP